MGKATSPRSRPAKGKGKSTQRRLSPARSLALQGVAPAALNEGVARSAAIAAVKAAGGNQAEVAAAYKAGRIGASLRRMGSNLADDELIVAGQQVLAMANPDAKKLADGQVRRSPEQQRLYVAANVAWHSLLRDAGIVSTGKGAGNTNAKGAKRGTKSAKSAKSAKASNKPQAAPIVRTPKAANDYIRTQAAAMLSFANKNAARLNGELAQCVASFAAAVRAVETND